MRRLHSMVLLLLLILATISAVVPVASAQTLETTLTLPCTPKPPGQVGWWPGDGSGEDISGLANPGTLLNGATFAPGKVDQAFSFDGQGAVVQIANEASFDFENTNAFTIDAWINTTPKGAGDQFIVAKQDVTINPRGYYLLIADQSFSTFEDTLTLILQHGSPANFIRVQGTTDIIDGQWHHVAAVYNGNGLASGVALYVDGVQQATLTLQDDLGGNTILNDVPLTIGTRQDNLGIVAFNGLIDEVEVYNTALTTSQIQAIFDAGVAGKCRGGAVGVAVNPNTDRVFVTSASPTATSKGAVSVIQDSVPPSLPTVLPEIAIFLGPALVQAAVNPNTNRLFVPSHASDSVFVIDVAPGSPTENTVVATIPVGDGPSQVAVNTNTNRVYVTNSGEPFGFGTTVTVIQDVSPPALPFELTTLTVGTGPLGVAANPATNHVFVANSASGTVSVIEDNPPPTLPTALPGSPFSVGSSPGGVAVNPSTGHVFVTHQLAPGSVTVIQDGASISVAGTLSVGDNPFNAAVNTNTNHVFVNHFSSPGLVTVLEDGVTPAPLTTITLTGNTGAGIAVNTNTNRVYVPTFGTFGTPGNTVSVISDPVSGPPALTITAPPSVTVNTDPGLCSASGVTLGTPTVSGGTPPHTISNDAPVAFPSGMTTVTWTVTDSLGNTASDTQLATVVDNEPPTITAPPDTAVLPGTPSGAIGTATASDNCPGITITNDAPAVFQIFSLGPTTVTWTATDAAGAIASSTQTVAVDFTPILTAITNAVTTILDAISDAVNSIIQAINTRLSFFASPPGSVVGVNAPAEATIFEMTNTLGMVSGYINAEQLDATDQLRVNIYIDITDNGVFDPVLFKGPAPIDGKAPAASAERIQIGPLPVQLGIRITVQGSSGDVSDDTIFFQFFVERSGT